MTRRAAKLAVRAVASSAVGLVLWASPAAADPPRPGDYVSEVVSIEPEVEGVDIAVFGGDAFLRVTAEPGVEVVVFGYEGEPYLRFRPDGGVDENRSSPATYLNDDRFARVEVPARLSGPDVATLDPEWEEVASGHTYAWHDHRVHWMAPNAPPAVARGGSFDWNGPVTLLVDGEEVEVLGRISYREDVSPIPWLAAAVVVAVGGGYVALRRPGRVWALAAVLVAAAAGWVSWATVSVAPAGSGVSTLPLWMAVLAAAATLAAMVLPERPRPLAFLAGAALLSTWALFRLDVLTNPVLPTSLPFAVDRAVTALALGTAVAMLPTAVAQVTEVMAEDHATGTQAGA